MAGPRVEVVDESGSPLASYYQGGRTFVEGDIGARYLLRIVNPTPRRVEAVVSVDGLDAIDGRPASTGKRGYLVPAYGEVTVDGWRTSLSSVAAFRFSSVRGSYAGRTGHDRNVGVIGVAFFRERPPRPQPPPRPYLARPSRAGGRSPFPSSRPHRLLRRRSALARRTRRLARAARGAELAEAVPPPSPGRRRSTSVPVSEPSSARRTNRTSRR